MSLVPVVDLWSVLIFLGAAQAAFLSFNCLVLSRDGKQANTLLGWLMLSVCLTVIEVLLCYSGYIVYVPWLVGFSEPFNFVFPPLMWAYTFKLAHPQFRWKAKHNWAFLPALLLTIYMLPFFAQSNVWLLQTVAVAYHKTGQIDVPFHDYAWASSYTAFYRVFKYLLAGYQIAYLLLTLRIIYRYKRTSGSITPSLRWVTQISGSFLVVFFLYTLLTLYYQSDVGDVYVASCVSLVCFGMSFRLISKSTLLTEQPDPVYSGRAKYEKTALDEHTARQTLIRLRHYLEQEKPYRQPDLSLPVLASQLTTAPHHLSQVINQYGGQNFFDFINSYRVQEIQQKLLAPAYRHVKIEALALDSGFQSKSAFNAAFKKMTGQTPSQYRKQSLTLQD